MVNVMILNDECDALYLKDPDSSYIDLLSEYYKSVFVFMIRYTNQCICIHDVIHVSFMILLIRLLIIRFAYKMYLYS